MDYDKENILNALSKTGLVELVKTQDFEFTFCCDESEQVDLTPKLAKIEKSIDFLLQNLDAQKKKPYCPKDNEEFTKNFFVTYEEFINAKEGESYLLPVIEECEKLQSKITELNSKKIKLNGMIAQLSPYLPVKERFSDFASTKNSSVFFGTIKKDALIQLEQYVSEIGYVGLDKISIGANAVIVVVCLNEKVEELSQKLSELAFNPCPFKDELTAEQKKESIVSELNEIEIELEKIYQSACELSIHIRALKILADYYSFSIEKQKNAKEFRATGKTLVLEGFVPEEATEIVKEQVKSVSNATFIDFSKPTEDEEVPTLTKNGKLVTQAEFVTELYSTPSYREIDPNKIMSFFFMLFMGIIMADIGYGILMIALGTVLAMRIKVDNGTRRLWLVIAIGGVFTILFGVLFNSFFGVSILPFSILPSPTPDLETGAINLETIMVLLLACLGLGAIQIAVGYFIKALNCFKKGDILDGIFDGIVWVLFFVGLICATFNFLCDYLKIGLAPSLRSVFDALSLPGLILTISTVAIAALTAGRHEKGFGKFSKGFGAVYGIINIISDVLSYARLFGLMLSGMIIAQTFNYKLGMPIISGGGIGYVLGALIIVIGHVFNLAMGVLGAYIHDSRLQYIEFFSKFYTGEGKRFTPLGSQTKYIYFKN